MSEKLILDEAVGNRRAIDRDHRTLRARRQFVNRPRDDFLAGAALALDQHRRVRGRDLAHYFDDFLDRRILPDDPFDLELALHLRSQELILLLQIRELGGLSDRHHQRLAVGRLGEIVEGAVFHRLDGALDR